MDLKLVSLREVYISLQIFEMRTTGHHKPLTILHLELFKPDFDPTVGSVICVHQLEVDSGSTNLQIQNAKPS